MGADWTRSRVARVAQWAVLLVVFAALGRDVTTSGKPLTLMLVFGFALLFALLRPKIAAVVAIVSAFTLDWLTFLFPVIPERIVWVQEVVLLALAVSTVLYTGRRGLRGSRVYAPLLWLVAAGAVSTLLNLGSPIVAILGFRNYFKHVLLFFALVNLDLDEKFRKGLIRLLIWLAALQVPVAVIQRLGSEASTGDIVGGTLGPYSSGVLTILLLGLAGIAFGWYLARPGMKLQYALLAVVLLVPTAINETKVLFFAAPLVFVVLLRRRANLRTGRAVTVALVAVLFLWGAYQAYQLYYGSRVGESVFSREYVTAYLTTERIEGGVINRLPATMFALGDISQDPITLVFGHGPGSASDSAFEFGRGPVYEKYGSLKVDSTFAARFILEYGLFGLVLFVWLIGTLLGLTVRVYRASGDDTFWQGVVIGYEGILVLMVSLSIYTSTFTIDALSVTFWTIAGLLAQIVSAANSDGGQRISA